MKSGINQQFFRLALLFWVMIICSFIETTQAVDSTAATAAQEITLRELTL